MCPSPQRPSPSCLDQTWVSLAGRSPVHTPCPRPHLHEGRRVHHVARVQGPLGALLCVPHPQVLSPASGCFVMLSTCTQRSVTWAGHSGWPPVQGLGMYSGCPMSATSSTVKSTVLVLPGLRPCFWEHGLQGHWSDRAQSPGPDCGLGGMFLQSPASPSSQAVPGWKHPVGSPAQAPNTQAGPLAMRTHKTHKGLCPSPETVLGKARRNQVGRMKGRNICPPHK